MSINPTVASLVSEKGLPPGVQEMVVSQMPEYVEQLARNPGLASEVWYRMYKKGLSADLANLLLWRDVSVEQVAHLIHTVREKRDGPLTQILGRYELGRRDQLALAALPLGPGTAQDMLRKVWVLPEAKAIVASRAYRRERAVLMADELSHLLSADEAWSHLSTFSTWKVAKDDDKDLQVPLWTLLAQALRPHEVNWARAAQSECVELRLAASCLYLGDEVLDLISLGGMNESQKTQVLANILDRPDTSPEVRKRAVKEVESLGQMEFLYAGGIPGEVSPFQVSQRLSLCSEEELERVTFREAWVRQVPARGVQWVDVLLASSSAAVRSRMESLIRQVSYRAGGSAMRRALSTGDAKKPQWAKHRTDTETVCTHPGQYGYRPYRSSYGAPVENIGKMRVKEVEDAARQYTYANLPETLMAHLVKRLGDDPERWHTVLTLLPGFTGSVDDLVEVALTV